MATIRSPQYTNTFTSVNLLTPTMKYLLAIALALLAYLAGSPQNKFRKEINYIQSTYKATNALVVETGNKPNLYLLRVKNNPLSSALHGLIETSNYYYSEKIIAHRQKAIN